MNLGQNNKRIINLKQTEHITSAVVDKQPKNVYVNPFLKNDIL